MVFDDRHGDHFKECFKQDPTIPATPSHALKPEPKVKPVRPVQKLFSSSEGPRTEEGQLKQKPHSKLFDVGPDSETLALYPPNMLGLGSIYGTLM